MDRAAPGLRGDLIAGLTVWAVLVPEALAYAAIAGVSPVVGLYAAPGALILYAALGSSRHRVTGPMAATAALSAATVGELAKANTDAFTQLTIALALCVGAAAVLAGLLRLGFLAAFISEPVLKGFVVGLALTIIVGQVPKLLGVESGDGDFFEKLVDVLRNLGSTVALTLVVGGGTLVLVLDAVHRRHRRGDARAARRRSRTAPRPPADRARDVGLVRDVLRTADDDPSLRHVYPTVQAAVAAASGRR